MSTAFTKTMAKTMEGEIVYFILQLIVHGEGESGQELKVWTLEPGAEAETTEEGCLPAYSLWLALPALLCTPGLPA